MKFKISKEDFQEWFLLLWSPFLLITSIVLTPIQGTTPGYILGILSIVVLLNSNYKNKIVIRLFFIGFIYIVVYFISQFILYYAKAYSLNGLVLVNQLDTRRYFRSSHFTQSLYLIPALFTFFYFKYLFNIRYIKYLKIACLVLCFYGFYEWFYFLLFHSNGDFLTNRTFDGGEHSGSLFQRMYIGGFQIMRLKSLTGEPSMFSFMMLPFFVFFNELKDRKISIVIFISLLLSTSTSAILGLVIYGIMKFINLLKGGIKQSHIKFMLKVFPFIIFIGVKLFFILADFYNGIINKISLNSNSISGIQRFSNFINHINFWKSLNIFNEFFGIGFGTVRSTDMFSTLLVNVGIFGVICYSIVFLYPYFFLKNNPMNKGIAYSLIILYIVSMISVSEFSYLNIWIFLGLAYNKQIRT